MDSAIINIATIFNIAKNDDEQRLVEKIKAKINNLIVNDFEKFIALLYRIDVSENKIDQLLKKFPKQDAADIFYNLILEREVQKQESRKSFIQKNIEDNNEKL